MSRHGRMQLYVPLIGQHDNIGDVILRRELLEWIHDLGDIHAFVGASTSHYDEALGLDSSDMIYKTAGRWVSSFMASMVQAKRVSYVFKPGEIQFEIKGLKEHVGLLPLVALTRAGKGAAIRVGVGARSSSGFASLAVKPSVWLSNLSYWRDDATMAALGQGTVIPDLGFGQGMQDEDLAVCNAKERTHLVISLRFDRSYPPPEWFGAVRGLADELALDLVVVTQVARDNERSKEVAAQLGAQCLEWDGVGHWLQEQRLRDIYRKSKVVLSDRLHVLIAAVTEGAIPIAGIGDHNDKIARHFRTAGFPDITVDLVSDSKSRNFHSVRSHIYRRDDVIRNVVAARKTLRLSRARVREVLEEVRT